MSISRLRRIEERSEKRRLALGVSGIIGIITLGLLFGTQFLEKFSLTADKFRGSTPITTTSPQFIFPPELNPLPEATNSGILTISGKANSKLKITLLINDEVHKQTTASDDGTFTFKRINLKEGSNTIKVKQSDGTNESKSSDPFVVNVKNSMPDLEISSPDDNTNISGDNNRVSIIGKTNESNSITVNDRWVIVKADGSFSYPYALEEGETILKIRATDSFGNSTTIERKVIYHK